MKTNSLSRPRSAGFTLIEMTVVVAMIGVGVALAGPTMITSIETQKAREEVEELKAMVRRVRNRARITGCTVRLYTNHASHPNSLYAEHDPADAITECQSLGAIKTAYAATRVALTPFEIGGVPTEPLVFDPDGGLTANTFAELQIENLRSTQRTIVEVWPAIGSIRVVK